MIQRFGWSTPQFKNEWQMMRDGMDEYRVADWAEQHPESIFFFIHVTTEIG